ncbi:MAG: M20/M25/M40 family metallo-hydrolase [Ignavibacteriales bacterium]|nr:M20/M25/M40 family metallo-hydrolase [Ignavibacteriales bacterium]
MKQRFWFMFVTFLFITSLTLAQQPAPPVDTTAIAAIREEALKHSEVMTTLSYLTDVYGPRLTWSPEYREAAQWASGKLKEWGLQNVHFENWAPLGKGWTLKRFSAQVTSPRAFPLEAYPKAWSPSIKGTVEGEVVLFKSSLESDFEMFKGKLKGAIVLLNNARPLRAHFTADASRITDSALVKLANADVPGSRMKMDSTTIQYSVNMLQVAAKKIAFCQKEGAAVLISNAYGDDGTVFAQEASSGHVPKDLSDFYSPATSAYGEKAPTFVPQVSVASENYNRIIRMIEKGQKVRMAVTLDVAITKPDSAFNIIAEIPGTDLKNEIVMIGAHFDSWQAGTGATDNGTGSAVCLEAVRILQKLGLKPRRTIRIGLWGGEEQGLFGSHAYVSKHFAEQEGNYFSSLMGGPAAPITKKPDYEKFSVYFNNDNGTGKVRGVYMQGNEAARPIFREWLAKYNDPTAQTLSLSNTGGTDHLSFDGVGLPGFQFIQDPIDYEVRTHHMNEDVWDRGQEGDLKQASAIMAIFAYNAAMQDARFPRKPMNPSSGK